MVILICNIVSRLLIEYMWLVNHFVDVLLAVI